MKIRIRFSKQGDMKFIGHLDLQRFFQKVMRRSGIDIRFSEGLSPHMIMSFASPLGLGITSEAEYVDIEVGELFSSEEMTERMNRYMPEGLHVSDCRQIEEGKGGKAMALVAAADYAVRFREAYTPARADWLSKTDEFISQKEILVMKENKKAAKKEEKRGGRKHGETSEDTEVLTDIRPLIYEMHPLDNGIFMRLACGSAANLKPETVMQSYCGYLGIPLNSFALLINRLELYADKGTQEAHCFISLNDLGEKII